MSFRGFIRLVLVSWCVAGGAVLAHAGEGKRMLSPDDFDGWRSIVTPTLSRDGQWLAYSYMPQQGDGEVVVRNGQTSREYRAPAGEPPPPPFPLPTRIDERQPPGPTVGLQFTSEGEFLLSFVFPSAADQAAARVTKAKGTDAPQRALLITRLATGEMTRVEGVRSVQTPARGGAWVAYLREPDAKQIPGQPEDLSQTPTSRPSPANTGSGAESGGDADTLVKLAPAKTTLVLRNLATGAERRFAEVSDYSFARDGRTLLFVVAATQADEDGVFAVTPGNEAAPVALLKGRGRYVQLTWDRTQTQAAFLSDRDDATAAAPRFKAYHWRRGEGTAKEVVSATTPGMPAGMTVSEYTAPEFSFDGRKLFVGVAAFPTVAPKDERDPEKKVTADIWSWNDGLIQSRQEVRASADRRRTFRGVLDLASQAYTQIADETVAEVAVSDDGTRALGFDYRPYLRLRDFDGTYGDIYAINTATGGRRLLLRKLRGNSGDEGTPAITLSPDGRWAAYFDDRQWRLINVESGESRDLTSKLGVAFQDEEHDQPEAAKPYGWAGWADDSRSLLLYDRYDAWQAFVDGTPARNLTRGAGRAQKIIFRVQDMAAHEEDDASRGFDPARPLIVRGESEETRATGYFRTSFTAAAAPQRLLWRDCEWRIAGRALGADVLMMVASRFDEFPDVYLTDENFTAPRRVTDGQAQLAPFKWGRAELVNYRNADGVALQALLYKPADFDPTKKYPLIVYTYERLSLIVHRFFAPSPGSNISFPFYASHGYLILLPDITYTTGHPGRSALNCVLPALDAVIARGYVDENALGIQGSSWGGYQSAYLITQTHRFRAAEAGAVVGNMTSAYGGIRWISGQPRLFQYEKTQSRIGASLADAPELYLENSPVFHVKDVTTPLLIMHNDRDGAVPWEQAVELFLSLRRYEKPVWLFNYHDEGHGLSRRADQVDFSHRMWQFFEHYLHGAPAPEWLEKGVPYIERDAEKRRFEAEPWSVPARDR
ncbi:prolyl oligopeptidase family serine peptidase [Horticoccus luteus]|uniref:Prolyl oligopeptidase family serine peptidase n=1 Tax=Horticoccus luteus TaxID=2862869 RepID=A0A8F9XGP7_9BACT|nr:prolyl oligopeptidase family serine peptidase [Horticoccus luteus]QYM78460.1 prolyl oligopeptidase family serine peptidase [Horticoccus luteus]